MKGLVFFIEICKMIAPRLNRRACGVCLASIHSQFQHRRPRRLVRHHLRSWDHQAWLLTDGQRHRWVVGRRSQVECGPADHRRSLRGPLVEPQQRTGDRRGRWPPQLAAGQLRGVLHELPGGRLPHHRVPTQARKIHHHGDGRGSAGARVRAAGRTLPGGGVGAGRRGPVGRSSRVVRGTGGRVWVGVQMPSTPPNQSLNFFTECLAFE